MRDFLSSVPTCAQCESAKLFQYTNWIQPASSGGTFPIAVMSIHTCLLLLALSVGNGTRRLVPRLAADSYNPTLTAEGGEMDFQ